jgi:hypothetical protein
VSNNNITRFSHLLRLGDRERINIFKQVILTIERTIRVFEKKTLIGAYYIFNIKKRACATNRCLFSITYMPDIRHSHRKKASFDISYLFSSLNNNISKLEK